jgi:hypothetical protein
VNHQGQFSFIRIVIVCGSLAIAIFAGSAPIGAQQKPIVVDANSTAATTSKALTVINKPGGYFLEKNIVNGRAGYDAVLITVPNVTIDMQGNEIMSTTTTTGNGINATGQSNIVIYNGIISGFGGSAIVAGSGARISGITATGNGSGISCGVGCLARDNVLQDNTGFGLTFSDATSGYLGNVLQGNSGNTVGNSGQVSGGTSLNQNVCNGVAC